LGIRRCKRVFWFEVVLWEDFYGMKRKRSEGNT
jgi:hypothetical protein